MGNKSRPPHLILRGKRALKLAGYLYNLLSWVIVERNLKRGTKEHNYLRGPSKSMSFIRGGGLTKIMTKCDTGGGGLGQRVTSTLHKGTLLDITF